ncbi:hypothetical protein [Microcoleus sp. Pol12B5]|uniref:hypothetical protein n=1 Tax=Microcoleus sp. Pol12B5 TaxID=3055396 RepID=UPI002FD34958
MKILLIWFRGQLDEFRERLLTKYQVREMECGCKLEWVVEFMIKDRNIISENVSKTMCDRIFQNKTAMESTPKALAKLLALPVADKYKDIASIDLSLILKIFEKYKAGFVIDPQN